MGAKADAFAFLLGVEGGRRSVREIAVATRYSPVAIRTAVQDMVLGGLIREIPGHPARDFFEAHETALHLNAIPFHDISTLRGLEFLDGFEETVGIVSSC